ncbi:hypothetical protein G3I40_28465 [Streptomyces sp. SID14478]|uniref:hypothetical protein n=1 Tax=Streptomyces sp. SID14478 TaxID=2706073 RepID=UPI0013DB52A4|nr:hypothetical protein [Streptomyces sp. SID14478]NEB79123.1 hypothetical protein [Streptomyces sp. SID14478]
MYALILTAATPFVLLATVMGLSWWEDRVLPPVTPLEEVLIEAQVAPVAPPVLPHLTGAHEPLTP